MNFPTTAELIQAAFHDIVEVTTYGREGEGFTRLKDQLHLVGQTLEVDRCLTLEGSVEHLTITVQLNGP